MHPQAVKPLVIALSIIVLFSACPLDSFAQVSVSSGIYTQNFDGLAVTGTTQPWVNNATLPGWYAHQRTDTTESPINQLVTGQSSSPRFAWYGDAQDYSLGSAYHIHTGSISIAIRLVNHTGTPVNGFSVGYTGEQWLRAPNSMQATDSLVFSYQIFDAGSGSMVVQNWINVPSLDFISPNATASTLAELNGNLPENQVSYSSWISGITLDEGQELWLRWTATDNTSFNDHALAIDDLIVTFGAIPEPAAYALGFGACALFIAMRRKRRPLGV